MSALLRKLAWLFSRRQRDAELREELEFHLAEEISERRARGLSEQQAYAAARRDLGSAVRVAEDTRDAWGWPAVEQVGRDVRYALRQVRRSRASVGSIRTRSLAWISLRAGAGCDSEC
jgi:macrolide transport system ATP-binding/permease protein